MKFAARLLKYFAARPAPRATAVAPAPLLLALEPRIVYDASVAAVGAAARHHAEPGADAAHRIGEAVAHGTPAPNDSASPASGGTDRHTNPAAQANHAQRNVMMDAAQGGTQVVFVDPAVTGYQTLLANLPAGTQVVMLNANTDGFAQIAQYLQQHPGVSAIHLLSHGAEGDVQAGAAWLDPANFSKYSAELAQIGAAMKPGGDFLIYGCDVAEGADGRTLVQEIAAATHLNVAASTDLTGAASLGGNWTLEYQVGNVQTPVIFSAAAEQQYGSLLSQTIEDYTSAAASSLNTGDVTSFSLDGITYTYNVANATTVGPDSNLQSLPDENGSSESLVVNQDGVSGLTSITITMQDGKAFRMSSFDIDIVTNTVATIEANGSTTNDITITSNGVFQTETVDLTGDSAFDVTNSITITFQSNSILNLGHLVYQEVTPPVVTTTGGATTFTSVDSSTGTPVAVDSGVTVSDTESGTMSSATVAITGNFHSGQDVLAFTNTSGVIYGSISGSYNATTGVLTLSGAGTTAQYQAALEAVTYLDTAGTPNTSARTISFSVNDGIASSTVVTKTVDVDSPPVVTTTGGTTSYYGGTSATAVDSGVSVTDSSQGTQASGTVTITSGYDSSNDTLSFTNTSNAQFGNISASFNSSTGTLTLTSAGGTATDAQWTHAFDAVKFSSASTTYGNRTISFVVNDGTDNSVAATKTVDVLNPNPVVTTDSGSAAFTAGDNATSTPVAIDSGLTVIDPVSSTLASATVAITGNFHSGQDVLAFTNDGSTMGNIVGAYNATTGVLTLTSSGATATLAQWQAALDSVTYTDTAVTPNNATRTISVTVSDNSNTSNTATRTVTVADVDQTPIVTTTGGSTNYVGGASATTVDGGVTVSDLDNTTQASGTVTIGSGFHSGDTLAFTNTSLTLFGNIVASYNAGTGVLTLSSSGASATDAQWANAFEAVTFSSASTTYGNRTVSFVVNDGTQNSTAATKTVDVINPNPVVTTDSGSAAFTAGDNTTSTPVTIDSGLTVTDGNSSTLASATIAITGNFHSGEDVLAFTNDGSTMGNIVGAYNATTGVLTLTSAGGIATVAQWQAALDSVTYTDTAVTPNNTTRTISFTASDGVNTSTTATRTVTVADVDQTPIVTTTGGSTSYTAGASATTVDGGVTVSDLDNTTQASGTVSIGSGFHSGDTLAFTNTSLTLFGNIVASYNAGTGVLTLTSSGATATDAQWANAFDAVTFSAGASATTGNRTISFVVNDGTENSTAATKTVDVLGPPTVTTDSGSAAFTAGDNVTSTPVTIDSGLTVTDGSSSTLASATIAITGNFHSGQDVLAFTNDGSTMGNIAGAYNATTGVLTLTSSGATATLAQWQAALDSVTYTDTAITPNNATRTISFTTNDGVNTSNTATRTVTVADVDQTPIVTTTGGTTTYTAGASATTVDGGVTVSDLDNTTLASGTVSIGSGFHSGDTLSFTNTSLTLFGNIVASYNSGTGVLTLTSSGATATDAQWANAFDAVTFSAGASATTGNRTISFVVNDGTENSAAATKTVDVLGPPTVTTDSGSAAFTAGDNVASTPVTIDSGLTVTDGSSSTLASATIAITGNFHSGQDVLAFTNDGSTMGNIAGAYNATTGVLTLTSSGATATLAQWQAALDSVTYTDTAITPNNATRTISFTTNDGANTSNTATRTVTVADVDQTPIVTTTGGTTNYTGGSGATAIDSGVTVSDLDNTTQSTGTVSITTGFHSGDTLSFTNTSSILFGNIVASYNSATGVLTLTSSGATAQDAQWANAFDAVTFSAGASATPGNRTVSFVVNDGIENSAAATKTVDVVGPPIVTTDSGSAAFTAGDNVTSTPVVIDSGLTVTDGSSSTLASATVAITGNFHSGQDVLAFTNDGSTMGNIVASYNSGTGVLTLTSSGATATLAQWQAALDSVTYTDTAITPNNATRTISFTASDNSNTSNTATRTVTVADVDQTPIVTTTGGTTNYTAGASATTVDGGVTVSDLDNTTLASGTVSIGSGFHSGDTLSFTNTSLTLFGNIVASYNAGTGVLTLTSSGATATDAQWANAFDAVTFSAGVSATTGNRTISFVVNDGSENSTAATKTVDVLGPPTVTTDSGSAAFTAGDNVTSTPVTIDSGLTVTDGSSSTLASATVAITGNFHSGQDVLAFTNDGSTMGNIAGAYNATTGVLTLTSSGATATLAQWQAALDSVTYTDTAITPNNATRTISFTTNDGANTSNTATRTVTVADVDQTPIVTTTNGTTTYEAGASPTTVDGGVTVSDRDNATLASGSVTIGSGFQSGDTLSFTNANSTLFGNISASYNAGTGVLTLTSVDSLATDAQWANAFDAVTFSAGTSATVGNRTISFVVNDGSENSAAVTKTVDVVGPPTVTTDSGSAAFTAGDNVTSTPVTIDSGLAVADPTSTTLSTATVAITGNFQSGEDVLSFTNDGATMGNIGSSYNATTGVLTLTSAGSSATLAQWRAALDAILYTDTAITPINTTRTISFTVNDGTASSALATRSVSVSDTDQTPIVTTSNSTTSFTGNVSGTAAPVAIDSGVTVSDRDNTTLASATVSITDGYKSGEDVLAFKNDGATMGNISGSFDAATGVLTLTSSGNSATLAQWQAALASVTYVDDSTRATGGTRTVAFTINDGTRNSVAAMHSVAVNPGVELAKTLTVQTTDDMPPPLDTPIVMGGANSAPLIVLAELDNGSEPGIVPTNVHTATFSGDGHHGNHGSVGETSVTATVETLSESMRAPIDIPVVIDHRSVLLGQPFALALPTLPAGRGDGSTGGVVTITVRQADGRPLPAWVHYDPATGMLSGTVPANGPRELHMVVVTRDASGHVTRREIVLDFRGSQNVRSAGHRDVPHAARAAAKPSLADQFVHQRRSFHVVQAGKTA